MAPRLILLMSSGSKKESRYGCLSEAKASHSQKMWVEVSSSVSHLLHSALSDSPIRFRCLLRVLRPVRRPLTALESSFGGLDVAYWPLVPKFKGSRPAEAGGFLRQKIPQHTFLRRGSKAVGPMS